MIAATGLSWILTLVFAGLAAYGGRRAAGAQAWPSRVSHGLHGVMAVAMAAMVWPWGMGVLTVPQTVFFLMAALWFPVAALLWETGSGRGRALSRALPHAAAMAAMAWMVHAMDHTEHGDAHTGASGHTRTAAEHHGGEPALTTMSLTGADALTAGILTVFFMAGALWWLAQGFDSARAADGARRGRPPHTPHDAYDLLSHGAKALCMAVMFALL